MKSKSANWIFLSTVLSVFVIICSFGSANASLVGDSVTAAHYYPDTTTLFAPLATATVTDDATDKMTVVAGVYTVDVNAADFYVDFTTDSWFNDWTAFNGLIIEGLNDDSGNPLSGVTVETNAFDLSLNPWNPSYINFTSESVELNLKGVDFHADTYFNVALDYGTPVAPEPVSSTLFVIGAATLGFRRFRRNFKN